MEQEEIALVAGSLERHRIDAVIATNTTLCRDGVAGMAHGEEPGGLSGRPLLEPSNRVIRELRRQLPGMPIIGVGGIDSGAAAVAKLAAGADLVQLYTGLIYRGPALVQECAYALREAVAASDATRKNP
jgi:dihydroorotate dehydrogenase